jgi:hypothetical protein
MGGQGASPDLNWRTSGRSKPTARLTNMARAASPTATVAHPPSTPRQTYGQAAASPPRQDLNQRDHYAPAPITSYPARVFRHPSLSHEEKLAKWEIKPANPETNTLNLGTSNMSRITSKPRKDIEIQAFHGGRFVHMKEMLRRLPIQDEPRKVVIAMGINDSNSGTPLGVIQKDIQATAALAKSRFPHSEIFMA